MEDSSRPVGLVFGLSSMVGLALQQRLGNSGCDGRDWLAISRQPRCSDSPGLRWQVGHLPGQGPILAPDERVTAIISLGPLDAFSLWLVESGLAPERVIALGSTSIDSKRYSVDPGERAVAQQLADAEARLDRYCRDRGVALLLLRPTLIYGMGGDRSLSPMMALARRFRCLPVSRRATGLRMPVHAHDIADVVLLGLHAAAPVQGTYALPGGERLTFRAMVERTVAVAAPRAWVVTVPHALFLAGIFLAKKLGLIAGATTGMLSRLDRDLLADGDAARRDLGFSPRPFEPDSALFTKAASSAWDRNDGAGPVSGA